MLQAARVAHQRRDLPRALVFLTIFSVSVCACDRLSIPTEPTASVAPPASSLPPLPPAPPPAYTVSGVVTDGSSFGPNGGLNTGSVTILDGAQAGTSVPIFTGGSYTLRNLPAGSVTLEASSLGYRTMRRAVVVEGDLRADFSSAANGADATAVTGGHLGRHHWQRCRSGWRRVLIRSNRRSD